MSLLKVDTISDSAGTGPTTLTGGVRVPLTSKVANYSATTSDGLILCDASGGGFAITLPAATTSGKPLIIKKTDSSFNIITINRAGSDTIEGATSTTLNTQYESVCLYSDGGTTWYIQVRDYPRKAVTYTPTFTGIGTATDFTCTWARNGAGVDLRMYFLTGSTSATEARISLPSGLTSDNSGLIPALGVAGVQFTAGNFAGSLAVLIEPNVTYVTFGLQGAANGGLGKLLGNVGFADTTYYSFFAHVLINGWK